jgi:hypothetical protein
VALARAMNAMFTAPIITSATNASARLGATATARISAPNAALVEVSVPRPWPLSRRGHETPHHGTDAHRGGHEPVGTAIAVKGVLWP